MLNGKVAVVTGASRGIGKAIAKKLASLGADIAVIYAGNTEAAEAVCGECIENFGIRSKAYRCDVSDYEMTKRITSEIKADFGTVNILVNNAGITRDGLVAMMKEDDFDAVLDTNLKGAFHMIRHCTGMFIRNRGGCIINISSVAGLTGNAGAMQLLRFKSRSCRTHKIGGEGACLQRNTLQRRCTGIYKNRYDGNTVGESPAWSHSSRQNGKSRRGCRCRCLSC